MEDEGETPAVSQEGCAHGGHTQDTQSWGVNGPGHGRGRGVGTRPEPARLGHPWSARGLPQAGLKACPLSSSPSWLFYRTQQVSL